MPTYRTKSGIKIKEKKPIPRAAQKLLGMKNVRKTAKKKAGGPMKKKGYAMGGPMKKGYKKGGKVRGAGIAMKGVRPAKMVKMKGS